MDMDFSSRSSCSVAFILLLEKSSICTACECVSFMFALFHEYLRIGSIHDTHFSQIN
jgi:hypothetical protein